MRSILLAFWACLILSSFANAETKVPENVIGLMAGEAEWLPQATIIAKAITHEDGLRVLPILGSGGLQALGDLSQLERIDAALVSSDSLAYAQQQNLLGGKVAYVANVAHLDVVLIARRGLDNVTALAGKRIASGPAQSAGFVTGELLFGAFEIPFLRVPSEGEDAIAALMAGKADAALVFGMDLAKLALKDDRFHILSLSLPPQLDTIYQTSTLQFGGQKIETVSTSLTLAVFDWPKNSPHYNVLKRFNTQLFNIPNHAMFTSDVLGWKRHASAQDAIRLNKSNDSLSITPTGGQP